MPNIQIKTKSGFEELLKVVEELSLSNLEQLMSQVIALQAKRKAPCLSKDEDELLFKINKGLPADIPGRLNELVNKRRAETLTPKEQQELLNLAGQIEKSDAERVRNLSDLARIRGVSLKALMKELKIKSPAYA